MDRKVLAVAGGVAVALAVAGCGSSGTTAKPVAAGAAATNAPKGAPFLLGWVNQDAAGAVPTYTGTAQALAAVKYVNAELGGVGGHPLQLVTCSTNGSPESSQTCANTLIGKGVKVVTKNFDGGWDAAIAPFTTAGLTVLGGQPTAGGEFTATNAFYYTGSAAVVIPSMAKYSIQTVQAKKIAVLTTSNPIAKAALPLMLGSLKAAGVTPTVITAPDDAADFSPFAAAIQQAAPDVLDALLTPQQCLPVMKALQSVQYTKPVVTTGLCNDPKILSAAGSAANGWAFGIATPEVSVSPNAPTSVLYRNVWKKYGSGALPLDAVSQLGVLDVVADARQLNQLPGDVLATGDAKQVQAAVRTLMTAPGAKDPLLDSPLRCGQSKFLPAVCGFGVYFNKQQDGKLAEATGGVPIDGFAG